MSATDGIRRSLPSTLEPLRDLALDLRWTWSHAADDLWRTVDPEAWERLENPWSLLENVSDDRLAAFAGAPAAMAELARLTAARDAYLAGDTWFARLHGGPLRAVAYFSM